MADKHTIVPLGIPGVGKSTILNLLIGDSDHKTFAARRDFQGVTRSLQLREGKLFGHEASLEIAVIDIPGIGDPTLQIEDVFESCPESMIHSFRVRTVLLVLKATDDRTTLGDVLVMNFMRLFSNLTPEHVVVIFTRCDQETLTDEFVKERLKTLSSYGISLDSSKVVKFDKSMQSLHALQDLILQQQALCPLTIPENYGEKIREIYNHLPESIRSGNAEVEGLCMQLEELQKHMAEERSRHRDSLRAAMSCLRAARDTVNLDVSGSVQHTTGNKGHAACGERSEYESSPGGGMMQSSGGGTMQGGRETIQGSSGRVMVQGGGGMIKSGRGLVPGSSGGGAEAGKGGRGGMIQRVQVRGGGVVQGSREIAHGGGGGGMVHVHGGGMTRVGHELFRGSGGGGSGGMEQSGSGRMVQGGGERIAWGGGGGMVQGAHALLQGVRGEMVQGVGGGMVQDGWGLVQGNLWGSCPGSPRASSDFGISDDDAEEHHR